MKRYLIILSAGLVALAGCGSSKDQPEQKSADISSDAAPLAAEPIPNVLSLPKTYPDTWFFANDVNFFSIIDGRIVILDAAADTREYKGQLPGGLAGAFAQSSRRGELYVAETIHEKRVRGPRHDYLTVYDPETLKPLADIELPNKRYQGMPFKSSLVLIDDDRLALVYNFTPAASVTVVDLGRRAVLSEIPIPGCAMMFPTGARSFSTICGNGGLTTIHLDEEGSVVSQTKTAPFIDIDNDAMFMMNAEHNGVRYFPTYLGNLQPVDFSGEEPKLLDRWSLLDAKQRKEGWRPGGWQLITNDASGDFYILIHPDGAEGTHKNPSGQIWVYKPSEKRRKRVIELETPAISIEATKGATPYLVALNINFEIDVYDARSGAWIRKIGGLATQTAFAFYAVE